LYDWQKNLLAIVQGKPDERKIYWYYEKVGGVGKSSFCKYLVVKHGALVLGGKASDMKYGVMKWKETNGVYPKNIIIDIPRKLEKFVSYQGLEEVKNACFFSGKYECGMVVGNNPNLIVFANFEPDLTAMSADRWVVRNLGVDEEDDTESSDGV